MTEVSISAVSHAATSSNGRPNEGYAVDYQLLGGSLEQFTLSSGRSMRIMVRHSPFKLWFYTLYEQYLVYLQG